MGFGFRMGDLMFAVAPVIISIGFVLFFVLVAVSIVQGLREWNRNNHSPRLTVPARVVAKRTDIHRQHHNGHTHRTTRYYVTFQVESGDRMEFNVSGPEYGLLAEGDHGKLAFQGTRFLSFERE